MEAAVIVPALLAVLTLVIFGARYASANSAIASAAGAAARTVTLANNPSAAKGDAQAVAASTLAGICDPSTAISGGNPAAGGSGTVTATVTCTVHTADLILPGVPGSLTLSSTATSVVDTYRERG